MWQSLLPSYAFGVSFNFYHKPHEVGLSLSLYRKENRPRKVK